MIQAAPVLCPGPDQAASDVAQVDQPLCIECSRDVVRQVDESIREAEDDIAAYQAALDSLQQENLQPMSSEVQTLCLPTPPPWGLGPLAVSSNLWPSQVTQSPHIPLSRWGSRVRICWGRGGGSRF